MLGRQGNLVDPSLFALVLDHEVETAKRLGYCLSLLHMSPDVPPHEVTPALVTRLAEAALRELRSTDLTTTLTPFSLGVLLVDAPVQSLEGILERISASATTLTFSVGGSSFPQTAASSAELVQQALELVTRARKDGGGRFYVAS